MSQFFTSDGQNNWSFSFRICFRMDWLDLLAVQGTLKSLLQDHSSKALVLQCSVFFILQLSQPYMTTGKTIALTGWTFVGKVMSLLFKKLSRLFIAFLPRSKCLLISWLQSPSAAILEPKKIKSVIFKISSVAQSCLTLCDPMNRSTPGLPVHYHLPDFTQTHVHRVGDAIQPSHPLSSPSPPAPNPTQHQSLFQ